jgi:hypothetical protein
MVAETRNFPGLAFTLHELNINTECCFIGIRLKSLASTLIYAKKTSCLVELRRAAAKQPLLATILAKRTSSLLLVPHVKQHSESDFHNIPPGPVTGYYRGLASLSFPFSPHSFFIL